MQARNQDMLILVIFSDALLAVGTVSLLGFLKLLKPLSNALHQLGYLAAAEQ